MTNYPKTLAAVRRCERAQWAIADALLEEIPPSEHGVNDGSGDRFRECADMLAKHGYADWQPRTLRYLRDTAARFPEDAGRPASVWVAYEAGTPEVLAEAGGVDATVRSVRQVRREHLEDGRACPASAYGAAEMAAAMRGQQRRREEEAEGLEPLRLVRDLGRFEVEDPRDLRHPEDREYDRECVASVLEARSLHADLLGTPEGVRDTVEHCIRMLESEKRGLRLPFSPEETEICAESIDRLLDAVLAIASTLKAVEQESA